MDKNRDLPKVVEMKSTREYWPTNLHGLKLSLINLVGTNTISMSMVKFMHQTSKSRTKYIRNDVVSIRPAQGFKKHFAAVILPNGHGFSDLRNSTYSHVDCICLQF